MKQSIYLDRLISLCYDILFIVLTCYLLYIGVRYLNKEYFHLNHITYIIVVLCLIFYFLEYTLLAIKLKGTLGHYLNDLRIESTKGKITIGRLMFREMILKHLLYITIIGFIGDLIFYIVKRKTIHDYYLKTEIVKKINENEEESKKSKNKWAFLSKNK